VRALAFVACTLLASCGSESIESQHAQLADLGFDVPAGWHRVDRQHYGVESSEWQPEENGRKESLLVIRSQTAFLSSADPSTVAKLLAEIPNGFRDATFSRPWPFTTRSGLAGARIEGDYTPSGTGIRYHRVHVVVVAKSGAIVHVLYTARSPDSDLAALKLVIDSIRNEEA